MLHFGRRRPSAAMVVSLIALVVAASGTAMAASHLVSGDSLIKDRSLSGNRLRDHTLTGLQIRLSALGTVPDAKNARELGGKPASFYLGGRGGGGGGSGGGGGKSVMVNTTLSHQPATGGCSRASWVAGSAAWCVARAARG